jgi:hypothetical protein
MLRMLVVPLMAAFILGACTQFADITIPLPLTIQDTEGSKAPTHLMTQTSEETKASTPATEEIIDPRIFVVDSTLAAESSAGDHEREIMPLRMWMPRHDGWVGDGWALLKRRAVPPTGAGITFDRPLILFADRCTWDDPDGEIEIDYNLEDFVDALIENPQYSASNVRDITVSGFPCKELDMLSLPTTLTSPYALAGSGQMINQCDICTGLGLADTGWAAPRQVEFALSTSLVKG